MRQTKLKFRTIATPLSALIFLLMIVSYGSAVAQTIGIRSAIVQPGDTITLPVAISADILDVYGFQLDLQMTPSAGA